MIRTNIEDYTIEVFDIDTNTLDSSDNNFDFDFIYSDPEIKTYKPNSKHGINVFKNGNLHKSALLLAVGGGTGIYENSFLIDKSNLLVCCSDTVFCLSIPDLNLNWNIQADEATCFKIFKIDSGYLIHGEMSITKLNFDGEIVWQNSGCDIFVNLKGEEEFKIHENYILATDFNGEKYKFDFNGNIL